MPERMSELTMERMPHIYEIAGWEGCQQGCQKICAFHVSILARLNAKSYVRNSSNSFRARDGRANAQCMAEHMPEHISSEPKSDQPDFTRQDKCQNTCQRGRQNTDQNISQPLNMTDVSVCIPEVVGRTGVRIVSMRMFYRTFVRVVCQYMCPS